MTDTKDPKASFPIVLAERQDAGSLVGARWWYEGLEREVDGMARRTALIGLLALGVGITGVGIGISRLTRSSTAVAERDTLEAQRNYGWDVGAPSAPLDWAAGRTQAPEQALFDRLPFELAPMEAAHKPFYLATLFQSLSAAATPSLDASTRHLREQMKACVTTEMEDAFSRGRALSALTEGTDRRGKAFLVDLPGPLAVAFAAGLANHFDVVFAFDGWPHPLGVVPAHLTLGAILHYFDLFQQLARTRPRGSPPVFVLDRSRLAPYGEESALFDNRYVAKIPDADALAKLGVTQLLYVTGGGESEADDLNDDFVALAAKSIELRPVALSDFTAETSPPQVGPAAPEGDGGALGLAGPARATAGPHGSSGSYDYNPNVYYGGHRTTHFWFWHSYGWGSPRTPAFAPSLPSRPRLVPYARPTPFAGLGTGFARGKPPDFARVNVHTSPSGVVGTSRSGSWGRSSGGWSWGGSS